MMRRCMTPFFIIGLIIMALIQSANAQTIHYVMANTNTQSNMTNKTAEPSCEPTINMTCNYIGKAYIQATADAKTGKRDTSNACPFLPGEALDKCIAGYNSVFNAECDTGKYSCK